jgi:hypothetical protein
MGDSTWQRLGRVHKAILAKIDNRHIMPALFQSASPVYGMNLNTAPRSGCRKEKYTHGINCSREFV